MANDELILRLTTAVFFEVAFVLLRRPDIERDAVLSSLATVLEFDGPRIEDRQALRETVRETRHCNAARIDAYLVATMVNDGSSMIVSFDCQFDNFTEIERAEP